MFERQKAGEFANSIRDLERRGKSQVVIVEDGEEPKEMTEVRERTRKLPAKAQTARGSMRPEA